MRSLTLRRSSTEFGAGRCDTRRGDMGGLAHRRGGEMRGRARRHRRSLRGVERGCCRPCHRGRSRHCGRPGHCGRGGVYHRRGGTRHCGRCSRPCRRWTLSVWLGGRAAVRHEHRAANRKDNKQSATGKHERSSPFNSRPQCFNALRSDSFVVATAGGTVFRRGEPSGDVLREGRRDPLRRPVDLIARDHQRRSDPDGVFMGVLG